MPDLIRSNMNCVLGVDMEGQTVHFFTYQKSAIQHDVLPLKARAIDDAFFGKLGKVLAAYRQNNPQFQKPTLILPNSLFLMDSIQVPSARKDVMHHSLNLAFLSTYRNSSDLKWNRLALTQNRQTASFAVIAARKEILSCFRDVCNENQISISGVTFGANAAVNGALMINPKLKNSSFLLLNVQENRAGFSFVLKGKTIGFYELPFGWSILTRNRLAAEDLLFDHTPGRLLVLNARERAKAKQLTESTGEEREDGQELDSSFSLDAEGIFPDDGTILPEKRVARKLPKFMLRDTPQSREEYAYENFRLFVKWTLDLIASNRGLWNGSAVETVYVNIPKDYRFLCELINDEAQENKVRFQSLTISRDWAAAAQDLELFGGTGINTFNKHCNF